MTKNEFVSKVQPIVLERTGRSITVSGVESRLQRQLSGLGTSWNCLTNEQKSELIEPVAHRIVTSNPRYHRNQWSIPSINQVGLNGKDTYKVLEEYLERSCEPDAGLVGEVKLLSRQVLIRRLIILSEREPDIVAYDGSTKVGVIEDLNAAMPHLIAMNNPNCRCALYIHSFSKGPWAGHFYVGITEMSPAWRTKLHLIDAFRTDRVTGDYLRYHRFAQAIRETTAFQGDPTSIPFDTKILDDDLNSNEASQRETEMIAQFKRTEPDRLLNVQAGGSIGGRYGTKFVLLDGVRMYRSDAIRQFCLEKGIDDEQRVTSNLNQHCNQHPQYKSDIPIEIRPLLDKACHIVQHGTKAPSSHAFKYQYRGELLSLREIAHKWGDNLDRLNSLRRDHKFRSGDVIDDYVDGKKTAKGRWTAPKCKPFYEYLKPLNPSLAQEWVEKTSRRGVSWKGLAGVLNESDSSVRYAAKSCEGNFSKFWASLGVKLDNA